MRIGLMDSGLGGLTVLEELDRKYKGLELFYYADQKNCPYGEKTNQEIEEAVKNAVDFLLNKKIEMLILACNTATAVMLPKLRKELMIPVVGVLQYGAQMAVEATENKRVAVWATKKTIETNKYEEAIKEENQSIQVLNYKCEEFVPLIEANKQKELAVVVEKYVNEAIKEDVDTIVLGCTHYPLAKELIKETIRQKTTKDIKVVNPAEKTIQSIIGALYSNGESHNEIEYYTSGNEKEFAGQLSNIMKKIQVMEGII